MSESNLLSLRVDKATKTVLHELAVDDNCSMTRIIRTLAWAELKKRNPDREKELKKTVVYKRIGRPPKNRDQQLATA